MLSHHWKSRAWVAGAALSCVLTATGPAPADIYDETVYLPGSSLLATSYVVPTSMMSTYYPTSYSSYIPTSYSSYIPTSYTSSSYIPTSYSSTYIPTSTIVETGSVLVPTTTTYYRPSLFRSRRYVERTSYSYSPTSYYMPTTYVASILRPTSYLVDSSLVTTSLDSSPCDTAPAVAPTRATSKPQASNSNAPSIISEPTNASMAPDRKPTATLNNGPTGDTGYSSDVPPPVVTSPPKPQSAPAPPEDKATLAEPPAVGTGAPADKVAPEPRPTDNGPVLPPPGNLGNKAQPNEMMYRQVKRPAYDTRNILRGRVISAETKRPVEGVTVILSSMTKQFTDRPAMSDADGEFKVSLPDGDWAVKVKMPSGSIFTVGQDYVTASGGKIVDVSGRPVTEYIITR